MNGKMQFVLVLLLTGMSFFAGYGYGFTKQTEEAAASAGQSASAQLEMGTSHGHGGSSGNEAALKTEASWTAENAVANENTTIRIHIEDESGKAVEQFDITHEKLLHLIVVSKDLSYFDHIHPEYKGGGEFEIVTSFPAGGEYKLIADYKPSGGAAATQTEWIKVDGGVAEPVPLKPDVKHSKIAEGIRVTLENDHPQAGVEFELAFTLTDANTQEPITDLEQYLGAVGHVVILSENTQQYLHVHPVDEAAKGPEARFVTEFPSAGVYKLWAQFQRNGKLITVPFVLKAE